MIPKSFLFGYHTQQPTYRTLWEHYYYTEAIANSIWYWRLAVVLPTSAQQRRACVNVPVRDELIYRPSSSSLISLAACSPSSFSSFSICRLRSRAARSSALRLQPITPVTRRGFPVMRRRRRRLGRDTVTYQYAAVTRGATSTYEWLWVTDCVMAVRLRW